MSWSDLRTFTHVYDVYDIFPEVQKHSGFSFGFCLNIFTINGLQTKKKHPAPIIPDSEGD